MKLLVTGGAGFIGSHFVRRMLRADDIEQITVLDALTYAGSRSNLGQAFLDPKLEFVVGDICNAGLDDVRLVDVDVDRTVPHLCQVLIPNRDQVHARLKARGIGVGVHYPPNNLQPAFAQWRRDLPATEQASHEILTLPFRQHLTEADIDQVVTALGQALTEARTTLHAGQSQQ
ncbi:DegT/DnrJ/EryC1/StrS family aminotransferase [Streptomyces griseofuscus]|uniref:DegT/DnrJ/EryC1/StrS family aminotransferase n=1 Tax=Streptomyces griseofuscus TaxID=146922 RepID=UPI0036F9E298